MVRGRMHGGRAGFTLVELVISLALLALLILGAHTAIRTSTQAVVSGERLIERTNKLRVTQELLRRQVSQALAMPIEQRRGTNESIFLAGGREDLTWVSSMPGYLGRGGPYVQRISLERGPGGQSLVFRHAMLNGWDPDDGFDERLAPPVTLLEGIRSLRIEYRALDEAGRLGSWQDRWDKPFQLPLLVRIRIEFERETLQQWPELVIPLLVDPGAGAINVAPIFGPRG
jgi:general secretion pathway protein J